MYHPPRTLYLHIGIHKTGTSYLQSCFHLSKDRLRAHGIDYPFSEVNPDTLSEGRGGLLIPGNAVGAFHDLPSLGDHLAFQ
jgi:hypothetical protein